MTSDDSQFAPPPPPPPTADDVVDTTPPVVESGAPGREDSAPVVEETPPVVEETSPVVEGSPPIVEGAPAVVTTAPPSTKSIRVLSVIVMIAGVILLAAGAGTWFVVRDQLDQEKITVSDDADHFAGDRVNDPFTAYSQANTIRQHALKAGGGKTYAELAQDDPARDTVMTASFLRTSLFTSVVSFGVAAFAAGIGLLMIIVGWALHRLGKVVSEIGNTTVAT